jgi:hypothetical protein
VLLPEGLQACKRNEKVASSRPELPGEVWQGPGPTRGRHGGDGKTDGNLGTGSLIPLEKREPLWPARTRRTTSVKPVMSIKIIATGSDATAQRVQFIGKRPGRCRWAAQCARQCRGRLSCGRTSDHDGACSARDVEVRVEAINVDDPDGEPALISTRGVNLTNPKAVVTTRRPHHQCVRRLPATLPVFRLSPPKTTLPSKCAGEFKFYSVPDVIYLPPAKAAQKALPQ